MTRGLTLARAAFSLVGVPFRLHGRDARTGVDCLGLVWLAMNRAGIHADAPVGYRLSNSCIDSWLPLARRAGWSETTGDIAVGDMLLMSLGPTRFHLLIAAEGGGVLHAHAGLRRVVHEPRTPDGLVLRHWRLDKE